MFDPDNLEDGANKEGETSEDLAWKRWLNK